MEYKIKEDLENIRKFYGLTQSELAEELGVERVRLARTEIGETAPRKELLDLVYSYAFSRGLQLNLQKEMLYKEEMEEGHILLTHSSKKGIVGEISTKYGRERNEFGDGFYCGSSYEKAAAFTSQYPDSCVYFIDFNPKGLKCVEFGVDQEWMLAIAYFRGSLGEYTDNPLIKSIVKKVKEADYIIAPIADNRMFQIIDSFIDGEITDEQCKHCLAATNLGMQYVFTTDKAVKRLTILERCFVCSKEKEHFVQKAIEFQKQGQDKSKLARIQYKNMGEYIEELLK